VFIVFTLNICTMKSVACILQQNERGKCFDQTPLPYHSASAYARTHISRIREPPLLRYKLRYSRPTLNPRPRTRMPLSEVSIYTEPCN
jgi:hypothetical protein